MLYQKIGENKYPIKKFNTFITQLGNSAVRIIGDVPLADNGFEIVDDNDNVIGDMSEFTYLYREDDTCKEYTKVAEEIIPTESFYVGDYPVSPIQKQISALSRRVSEITPYTQSKMVGIDDTECFFDYRDGNISAWLVTSDGQSACQYEIIDNKIRVFFDALTEAGTVNISIQ